MIVPKWLIPVIAVVAALAVGAAAVLIGFRFASSEAVPVAASKVVAPVLAPVDPARDLAKELNADGTVSGSAVVGERSVTNPDSVPAGSVPSDIANAVGALAASDDPGSDPAAAAAAASARTGDPCAPADGSAPPAGCPSGLRSTILYDIALPAFQVFAGSPGPNCLTREYGSTIVQFAAQFNAPATATLTWQQDGGEPHTQPIASLAADNDAWQHALAGSSSIGSWIWLHACVTLDHLTPNLGVRLRIDATDFQGRTATTSRTIFPLDTRRRPPTEIIPVGNSTVFVSAPMVARDEVRVRAIPVTGSTPPSCDAAPELTGSFQVIQPLQIRDISAASLAAANYKPEFTRRASIAFAVPAATQVLVCVRWYDLARGPLWEADVPYFRSEVRIASPDLDVPVVTLDSIRLSGPVPANSITLDGATENGTSCGEPWTGPAVAGSTAAIPSPIELCNYQAFLGRSDADGALNLTSRVQTSGGLAVAPHLLPIALEPCASCAGRSQTFDVPLSSFVRPARICSGDCPTNTGQAVGVARVTATWTPRLGSGSSGWHLGERVEGSYAGAPIAFPRMDTSLSVTLGAPDVVNRSQSAAFRLYTDRPVTYRVDLNPGACLRPGGTASVSSTAPDSFFIVQIPGLCVGTGYALRVTLTAADGSTAVYSPSDSEHLWSGGGFYTARVAQPMAVSVSITKPGGSLVYLSDLRLYLAGIRETLGVRDSYRCFDGAITPEETGEAPNVGEVIPVEVYLAFVPGADPDSSTRHADGSLSCRPADGSIQRFAHFTGSLTIDQLLAGAHVTITDPASGYTATINARTH